MILFLKTHVDTYTKKDGTVVAAHEDKRAAAREALHRLQKQNPNFQNFTGDEDPDDNNTPNAFRAGAAIHELKRLGWEVVGGDTAGRGDFDSSHYVTARRVVESDPEYGDEHVTVKVRIANHGNTTKLGHDKPDVNIAPGEDIVSDLEEKLNAKLEDEGYEPMSKSHPATQAMSASHAPADLMEPGLRRNPGEPSAAQAEAGTYNKPRIQWQGLTIAVENPAGSVRRGRNRHGVTWEVRMRFDYGEIVGSMGVDGDPVDIYMGPNPDAPMVYVVHQRRVNDWDAYDEDKVMAGFDCQSDAEAAFLSNYNDPRFLGPVTAMPVADFVAKVRATKEKPAMIKSSPAVVLFFKAHVGAYLRGGKMVNINGYQGRAARAVATQGQLSLFGANKPMGPSPFKGRDPVSSTPDMFDADEHGEVPPGPSAKNLGIPEKSTKPIVNDRAGDLARRLRDSVDKSAKDDATKSRMYASEAQRLRGSAGAVRTTPDVAKQYSEAADILDAWAKTLGGGAGAKAAPESAGGHANAAYNAAVTSEKEGPADNDPRRKFYVTVARAGRGVGKLAGPFDTHEEAKAHVSLAREHAHQVDPRSVFDAFGTVGVVADKHEPGILNSRVFGQGLRSPNDAEKLSSGNLVTFADKHGNEVTGSVNRLHGGDVLLTVVSAPEGSRLKAGDETVRAQDSVKRKAGEATMTTDKKILFMKPSEKPQATSDEKIARQAVQKADELGLKGKDRKEWVAGALATAWGMTKDEAIEAPEAVAALNRRPTKASKTKASERFVEGVMRQGMRASVPRT